MFYPAMNILDLIRWRQDTTRSRNVWYDSCFASAGGFNAMHFQIPSKRQHGLQWTRASLRRAAT